MKISRYLLLEMLLLWFPYKIFSRISISKILYVAGISLTDAKEVQFCVKDGAGQAQRTVGEDSNTVLTQASWKEWKQHSEYNLCSILNIQRILPGGLDSNKSACKAGDPGLILGSERSPGEKNGNPLQYSCLENSMDRGAWQIESMVSQRVTKPDTTEWLK